MNVPCVVAEIKSVLKWVVGVNAPINRLVTGIEQFSAWPALSDIDWFNTHKLKYCFQLNNHGWVVIKYQMLLSQFHKSTIY